MRVCRTQVFFFFFFANNSRSRQYEKNSEHSFLDIGEWETCAEFQQKILNSMTVGDRQSFQFFRKNTWYLKNFQGFA